MHVEYSNQFLKSASRLPTRIVALAGEKEVLFKSEPRHPSLGTHNLHGKDKDLWAFWINKRYRIKFLFLAERVPPMAERAVLFVDIGTHDIYK